MKVNLIGRVNNITLNKSKGLLPVFEAVINSFEAIEDANIGNKGTIFITVKRDSAQQLITDGESSLLSITGFIIEDNGQGFTDLNYTSFQTSDTQLKRERGGKGVGRFLWLKAFNDVHIDSVFKEDGVFYHRKFDFLLTDDEYPQALKSKIDLSDNKTTIHLINYRSEYKKAIPKKINTIVIRLIEHCLSFFLRDDCPKVIIKDNDQTICLNEEFQNYVEEHSVPEKFEIKGREFVILHLKLRSTEEKKHGIHLCANNRDVSYESLKSRMPNLSKRITENDGSTYTYVGYVSSLYLDENVNSERTGFDIPDDFNLDPDQITKNDLFKAIVDIVKVHLTEYLNKVNEEKIKKIKQYVQESAIEYRPLIKHKPELLESISPDIAEDKIEIELHKLQNDFEIELKKEGKNILEGKPTTADELPVYKKKLSTYIEKVNDVGRTKLADYIVHRRVILEIFHNNLKTDDDSKYDLEEAIHKIVFPLRTTSDDIKAEQQNLWLIDEKLAYHFFLGSDLKLNQIQHLDSEDTQRPDIIIFNSPFSFVDEDTPYGSIVIVEFKRPGRDDYNNTDKNPISQVYDYIEKIQLGKCKDKDGQEIAIQKKVPFYGYIIADITPTLKRLAENAMLTKTPDNMGYYGYNANRDAYIEIISYQKLVADARKRNQILFKKLNLPAF